MNHQHHDIVDKIKKESEEKLEKARKKKLVLIDNIKRKIQMNNEEWKKTFENFLHLKDERIFQNQNYLDEFYKETLKMEQLKKIEESINNNKAQVLSAFQIKRDALKQKLEMFFGNESSRQIVIEEFVKNGSKSEKLKEILKIMSDYQIKMEEEKQLLEEEKKKKLKNQENYN